MLDEKFEVAVDVGLELEDRLGREGMGDNLALAGVLGAVAGVEETALDADEGVVEGAGGGLDRREDADRGQGYGRFQEPVAVAIDLGDRLVVADADMVRLNPHDGTQLLVQLMDGRVAVSSPDDAHKPEVGELREKRCWDATQLSICYEVLV